MNSFYFLHPVFLLLISLEYMPVIIYASYHCSFMHFDKDANDFHINK